MRFQIPFAVIVLSLALAACKPESSTAIIWKADSLEKMGSLPVTAMGAPQVVDDGKGGRALRFDGVRDGVLLPKVAVAGWEKFTIEMDFFPASGGDFEQRFFHMQDEAGVRGLFELRSNPDGTWYFDAFVRQDDKNKVALIDPNVTHPSDRWYCGAMVYDGAVLRSYVDGVLQGARAVRFGPIGDGQTSLGVRQNKVSWFKGMIREVRFYPEARIPAATR